MDLTWVLTNATSLFLLWLLVSAGSHKLQPANSHYYEVVFTDYGIRPLFLAQQLPRLVGLGEVILGMALVIPGVREWGAVGTVLLLGGYFLMLSWQVLQGKSEMDCGCAGPEGELKVGPALLLRNFVLFALALGLLWSVGGLSTVSTDWSLSFWVLSLAMAAVAVLVYLSAEQLMATGQRIQQLKH